MNWKKYRPYLVFTLISLAVGGLAAIPTVQGMPVYQQLIKPWFTPPPIVFPIVWNILYVLMGIGAARIWRSQSPGRPHALFLFGAQLAVNFFWSVLFFGLHRHFLSFVWLILLIVTVFLMFQAFVRVDRWAGILQIPYLVWCVFAALLNFGIWLLNH